MQGEARVTLDGIKAQGRHGANPGERDSPQDFTVDLYVLIEVAGDSLADTIDYRSLVDIVAGTVAETSFQLLESVADAVARAIYEQGPVREVTAVVHKPGAARSMGVEDVSAAVTISG